MKYLLAFYGEERGETRAPDEMKRAMDAWSAFDAETFERGAYVACEGLEPAAEARTVEIAAGDERIVRDGPFAETKEHLGGFTLLECDGPDEALEWARKVPLDAGWKIEVRPVRDFTAFGYVDPTRAEAPAS